MLHVSLTAPYKLSNLHYITLHFSDSLVSLARHFKASKLQTGVLTHRCLLGKAPVYLWNCCIAVSQVASRRNLRSAAHHQLTVPRHRLSTYGRRAFAVAGPMMLNILPDDLRDNAVSTSTFRQSLKTHLFSAYQHVYRIRDHVMRTINVRHLLTYLLVYINRLHNFHQRLLHDCVLWSATDDKFQRHNDTVNKKHNHNALSVGDVNQNPVIVVLPPLGGLRMWLCNQLLSCLGLFG